VLLGRSDGLDDQIDWKLRPPYLRWKMWHCYRFFSEFSGFHLLVSFNHFSTLISITWHRRCINIQLAAPWVKHLKNINTSVEQRLWMRPAGQTGWQGMGRRAERVWKWPRIVFGFSGSGHEHSGPICSQFGPRTTQCRSCTIGVRECTDVLTYSMTVHHALCA
jgi:hypothetical protein